MYDDGIEEVQFPKSICPDHEAGKVHGQHIIAGTWRELCPGITTFEDQKAAADAPDHTRNGCPALPVGCVRCTAPATVRAAIAASQGLPANAGPAHLDGCMQENGITTCVPDCPRPAAIAAATWAHSLSDYTPPRLMRSPEVSGEWAGASNAERRVLIDRAYVAAQKENDQRAAATGTGGTAVFTVRLDVVIRHISGPVIDNQDHVLAWLTVDNALFGRTSDGNVTFGVCPDHADPDDCDPCPRTTDSVFTVRFDSAYSH
jgi:hypothetical protein